MAEESISVSISPETDISDEVRSRSSEGKLIASKARASKQPDPRRASTGSFNNGGRKFSSGKASSLNSSGSPVPHYLRASTGSCHDFCKYGKKHETEVKPWQTKARKVKNPTLNQKIHTEAGDSSEKKIVKLVKSKPPVSKTNSPSPSVSSNKGSFPSSELASTSRPASVKEDKTVNEMKHNVIEKQNTPVFRKRRESDTGLAILPQLVSAKEKGIAVKEKKKDTVEKQNTPLLIGRKEKEIKTDKTKGVSREVTRKLVSSPVAYLATKPSFTAILSSKGNKNISKNQSKIKAEHKHTTNNTLKMKTEHAIKVEAKETVAKVREKNQESIKEVENELIENEKVSDETLSVLKVDSEKIVPESKQNGNALDILPSEIEVVAQIETEDTYIENQIPELEQNEIISGSPRSKSYSSRSISSPNKSLTLSYGEEEDVDGLGFNKTTQNESTIDNLPSESLSSMNISSQVKPPALSNGDEKAPFEPEYINIDEKYHNLEENENTCFEEESQDELEYSETESDRSDDSISDVEEASVGNVNSETRKAKVVSDENDLATKLKFKRGKVVELKSNSSGPRRLRFRRGRVLDENQDKDVKNRRRSFTRGGVDDDKDGTNDDSAKVVLRHQEVEGKKDAQGLFNNVIEETASKLVETRKSKVKALVGAFETVISLQESKPATQTAPDEK